MCLNPQGPQVDVHTAAAILPCSHHAFRGGALRRSWLVQLPEPQWGAGCAAWAPGRCSTIITKCEQSENEASLKNTSWMRGLVSSQVKLGSIRRARLGQFLLRLACVQQRLQSTARGTFYGDTEEGCNVTFWGGQTPFFRRGGDQLMRKNDSAALCVRWGLTTKNSTVMLPLNMETSNKRSLHWEGTEDTCINDWYTTPLVNISLIWSVVNECVKSSQIFTGVVPFLNLERIVCSDSNAGGSFLSETGTVTCSNWTTASGWWAQSTEPWSRVTAAAQRAVHLFIQRSVKLDSVHRTKNWRISSCCRDRQHALCWWAPTAATIGWWPVYWKCINIEPIKCPNHTALTQQYACQVWSQ